MTNNRHNGIFYGVDGWTVLLYVLIVAAGWISITSASYDDSAADLLSFSHFYMKQLMWIGMAWVTAIIVLLLDERFYHMFAYPAYLGGIALLVAALLFGREVNGAKAWFEFGSLRVQPVEFAKIATALALARVMSEYSFSINQMALHPGAADRRAVHRLVPSLADDAARGADSGLHALRGDDERPVAFAPRVPGRGDAVGHPAVPRDGADRPRNARSLPQPAHNDPRGRGLRCRIRLPLESRQHLHHAGTVRRFARLPAHHRLHLQFDPQTAPARPYIEFPGQEPFGRIYCYCVAAILLFHVLVNVGMTIGLMPVMGIPLPFMSYGGSSLIAFTILLFIAVRLDASTRQFSVHKL